MANEKDAHACTLDKIISLCKRRGFVYQASEIYGGMAGAWDYGPLGVEFKRNIQNEWWHYMTQLHDDVVGLDSAIFQHHTTWEASGHVGHFSDPMVDCCECKARFRADTIIEDYCEKHNVKTDKPVDTMSHEEMKTFIDKNINCPTCGKRSWTDVREFNLMFKTYQGAVASEASLVYLRPETCQGIFTDFKSIVQSNRMKIPFGVAQVGKSFRNEIVFKNFIFRTCEFEQMEMEYFCKPGTEDEIFERWREDRWQFYLKYGIKEENLKWRRHDKLAHYAKDAYDITYKFPIGFEEVEGIHSRTDFDLSQHMKYSKKDMSYIDQDDGNKKYIPYVVETSAGLNRNFLMFLCEAYEEQNVGTDGTEDYRTVLHLDPRLAPITVAVLPLMKKDGMAEKAKEIQQELREDFVTDYDQSGTVGKRYRRQDEVGTPFCVTIDPGTLDSESPEYNTVTLRFRDSMEQIRVPVAELTTRIHQEIKNYTRK
ncbi:MAG: glycine--tRNA ligase [Treponema sp.]|jgi:glycyl-tRNA synthetase|nr:glycine--tRNA ligase [Treponema sp.]